MLAAGECHERNRSACDSGGAPQSWALVSHRVRVEGTWRGGRMILSGTSCADMGEVISNIA